MSSRSGPSNRVVATTPATNSCPASFVNPCVGSETFTVGSGDTFVDGTIEPATPNVFYDQHYTTDKVSMLDAANITSCSNTCKQTYSCGGNNLGTFTITRSYTKGTIAGHAVTNIQITKQ